VHVSFGHSYQAYNLRPVRAGREPRVSLLSPAKCMCMCDRDEKGRGQYKSLHGVESAAASTFK
jgi:hypothetical protein